MQLRFTLLCATLLLFLSACEPSSVPADDPDRPDPTAATIDLELGAMDGDDPYLFGRLGGVTASAEGRIFIADIQADVVRAYDANGQYLFDVATAGEGPGEVDNPCCLAIGPEGYLWVRDDQNRRYSQYDVTDDGASQVASVQMGHQMFGLQAPTTFDADGNVIDVGTQTGDSGRSSTPARFHQRPDGETVRTVSIPQPPSERLSVYEAEIRGGVARYPLPGGVQAFDAHAPNGDFAFAVSDRYEVVWADAAGDTLHVLSRTPAPIERSEEDEERIRETIEVLTERFDASPRELEQLLPDQKPPLESIFFDDQSRLWAQRAVPEDAPNEADIYDRTGTLVQVVQWPNDVMLTRGHITEDAIYGFRYSQAIGVPQVVRLRY